MSIQSISSIWWSTFNFLVAGNVSEIFQGDSKSYPLHGRRMYECGEIVRHLWIMYLFGRIGIWDMLASMWKFTQPIVCYNKNNNPECEACGWMYVTFRLEYSQFIRWYLYFFLIQIFNRFVSHFFSSETFSPIAFGLFCLRLPERERLVCNS